MTITEAIHVAGLTKSYDDHAVLRGVDLDVAPGSIFALLGSNGAGKTTLVRILATLLKADGGSAVVHGWDVTTQAPRARESISLTGQIGSSRRSGGRRRACAWSTTDRQPDGRLHATSRARRASLVRTS